MSPAAAGMQQPAQQWRALWHAAPPPARPRSPSRRSRPLHPQAAAGAAAASQLGDPASLQNTIVVLGAGPGGLAAAAALHAAGLPVAVLERRAAGTGASAALGLWTNAWRALDALGAAEPLRQQHLALDRVELCRGDDGRLLRSFSLGDCEGGPHEFRGVARHALLAVLEAKLPPGTVRYAQRVEGVAPSAAGASLQLAGGIRLDCLAVVAADGVRSIALPAAGRQPPRYVGQTAVRGIAELPAGLPPGAECIRQLWSGGPRAGMYPISPHHLYWFVCFDAPWNVASSSSVAAAALQPEDLKDEALGVVRGWHWGIQDAVEATPLGALTRSRISDRWDLPSAATGSTLALAGDALHPMTPNLGQGGGMALEDAVVLGRVLAAQPGLVGRVAELSSSSKAGREAVVAQLRAAFQQYEQLRLARCLPLTVKSFAFGAALQLPLPPVAAARDAVVQRLFSPKHFLSHAAYDCATASLD